MPLESLTGRSYGPHPLRVCPDKVAEYVLATGDDSSRWTRFAPPGFASVALFSVAPRFLEDPDVAPSTRMLVHVDQTFRWQSPWVIEDALSVRGTVERVRTRGSNSFVTFSMAVEDTAGARILDSASTFLMSAQSPDAGPKEESEPPVGERAGNDPSRRALFPVVGEQMEELQKSASRSDLVRYAGATWDWNPIHFDHDAAVAAGLPGIVVHGLLMAAWATQAGTQIVDGPRPLAEARFRFRSPLRPAEPAAVSGVVERDDGREADLTVRVTAGGVERMSATMVISRT